ncbi:MAG: hypothetical protein EPO07_11810 [Verrucomicrobia bacterium]|nr:MAG: hypothetical protein EPO07_11810 [Verrucomicrobiota bacterium]
MHKFGINPGQVYKGEQVRIVRRELSSVSGFPLRGEAESKSIYPTGDLYDVVAYLARRDLDKYEREDAEKDLEESKNNPTSYPVEKFVEACRHAPEDLAAFLTDLCVNPRLAFRKSGESDKKRSDYEQRLENEFPDQKLSVTVAELFWFQDIIGALLDYQHRVEESARADFVLTAIGRKVWETLDFALKARRMVVIEGWEGRGKSEAVKAWCRIHRGDARFVDLAGVTSKTTVFRAIAKALGIASSYSRTATEMQARIEDVLQRSRLVLVFDEAHFLFAQSPRIYSRPELIDWIDTALVNHDVPVALVTTPQFINCVKRAESQVGWNYRQFRRRVRRWVPLAEWNTDADLEAVARKIMPGISRAGIKLALGYAKVSLHGSPSRDISGLGDVATEARLLAEESGRETITFEDVERAINEHLLPSDTCFASRMAAPEKRARRRLAAPLKAPLTPPSESVNDGKATAEEPQIFQRHRPVVVADSSRAMTPRARGESVAA